jgi:hypothetical protein
MSDGWIARPAGEAVTGRHWVQVHLSVRVVSQAPRIKEFTLIGVERRLWPRATAATGRP